MNKRQRIVKISDDKLSHYIQTENGLGIPINVPVIDVRDGVVETLLAESIIKAQNKSRYLNYNQYHVSPKKNKTI